MDSTWGFKFVGLLCSFALLRTTDCHVFSHDDARSLDGPAPGSFVDSLFEEYGTNNSMTLEQFGVLLKELKVGKPYAREQESSSRSGKGNGVTNGHSRVSSDLYSSSQSFNRSGLLSKEMFLLRFIEES